MSRSAVPLARTSSDKADKARVRVERPGRPPLTPAALHAHLATAWPERFRQHLEERDRSHALFFSSWRRRPVVFNDGHPRAVYPLSEEPGRPLRPGGPLIGRECGFEWD